MRSGRRPNPGPASITDAGDVLVTTGLDVANEAFANLFAVGSSLSTFGSLDYLQRHLQANVSLDPP